MKPQYAAIVIGAGQVGLSCALALARHKLGRIALLDSGDLVFPWTAEDYQLRVSALNPGVTQWFADLEAWPSMQALRVSPYRQMQVWDSCNGAQIEFSADEVCAAHLGHIIENSVVQNALWQQLQTFAQVDIYKQAKAQRLQVNQNYAQLTLASAERLSGEVIIGADGAHSWLREQAHIELNQQTYDQQALVATITCEHAHAATARQVFLPSGPLALLPLADPLLCSMVWSASPERIAALKAMSEDQFNQALMQAFAARLGQLTLRSQRASFPLHRRHAQAYVQPRIALIGDAAHTIHPLAGQGANLGIMDAKALVEVLARAKHKQRDIGALDTLRRYQRARKEAVLSMLAGMDLFNNLFSNNAARLVQLRGAGLRIVDQFPWLKRMFMHRAINTK